MFAAPDLDDRGFEELMEEARSMIKRRCPDWTDLSPSDPGIVLLETCAYFTEVMLYRLNRIPEKTYVEFLRFLGIDQLPPAAASVVLTFSLGQPAASPVIIPEGTVVTTEASFNGEKPEFITRKEAVIATGQQTAYALAHHCRRVDGEFVGVGTGKPGLYVTLKTPPAVFDPTGELNVIVGVETDPEELGVGEPVMQIAGESAVYRIWKEVEKFSVSFTISSPVYTMNRRSGVIQFPYALGQAEDSPTAKGIVKKGKAVRVWYYVGGGPAGNLPKNALTVLKDAKFPANLRVTNPVAATGGKTTEAMESAVARAVKEIVTRGRAVTASDFELIATMDTAVARAKSFAKAAVWKYAEPGTASVLLVPAISRDRGGMRLKAEELIAWETDRVLERVKKELDTRKPMGTQCDVKWVRYKTVSVKAKVVAHRGMDRDMLKRQVEEALYATISPLPSNEGEGGWEFGKTLHISHIYSLILKIKGVMHVEQAALRVESVPDKDVSAVAADFFQAAMWFAASKNTLFRSFHAEGGWEEIKALPEGEQIESICVSKQQAGLLAIRTKTRDGATAGSAVYISRDCGETWNASHCERWTFEFEVEGLAWSERRGIPLLFMATSKGLYELLLTPNAAPSPSPVDVRSEETGYYAVTTAFDSQKKHEYVIAASQLKKGVYVSSQAGKSGTFTEIGFRDKDIRTVAAQNDELRTFLWIGETVIGSESGNGAYCLELRDGEAVAASLQHFKQGWEGGSCKAIDFMGKCVLAATHRAGVASLAPHLKTPVWERAKIDCGLPVRDTDRLFFPVNSLCVNVKKDALLAGTPEGVFKSDNGKTFAHCSQKLFTEKVPLGDMQLFCSGEHDISVELVD